MQLAASARMQLLKFVCSFAWTDLKVQQEERDLVMLIAGRLGLTQKELDQVKGWLVTPPLPEEVDPADVPRSHRELFLRAADVAVRADGKVVPAERDALALFRAMLR